MVIKRRPLGVMFPGQKEMNKVIFNTGYKYDYTDSKVFQYRHQTQGRKPCSLESDMNLRQSVCSHLQPHNVTILFFFRVSNYNIQYTHTCKLAFLFSIHLHTQLYLQFFNSLYIFYHFLSAVILHFIMLHRYCIYFFTNWRCVANLCCQMMISSAFFSNFLGN